MNPVAAAKLFKLAGKMVGGPNRDVKAGMTNVVKYLEQIIATPGVKKGKAKIAKQLLNNFQGGKTVKYNPKDTKMLKNIGANIDDKIYLGPNKDNIMRRELMVNPYENQAGLGYYLGMKKVPMIDVDLPIGPAAHMQAQMTHGWKTRGDFMRYFEKFLKTDAAKSHTFRLYETPGGYRLFDVGSKMRVHPSQHLKTGVSKALGQDRFYTNNLASGYHYARMSPKPGRTGDYVAKYKDTYGYGGINLKNEWDVIARHDNTIDMINDAAIKGNYNALGGWFDFMKAAPL